MRRLLIGLSTVAALAAGAARGADTPPAGAMQPTATVADAMRTPLKDLNIQRKDVPDVLVEAMQNPYHEKGAQTCAGIADEMARLNAALGADYDQASQSAEPPPSNARVAAGAVANLGVQSLIPFRGAVRYVSGAAAHDREVAKAADAGAARRGFLRGLAKQKYCHGVGPAVAEIDAPEVGPASPVALRDAQEIEAEKKLAAAFTPPTLNLTPVTP